MKKTFLLLTFGGLLALTSAAQVPAKAIGTPEAKIALNPTTAKPAAGKLNLTNVKLSPGMTRKLVTPPVLKNPPGFTAGEQLLTGVIPNEGPRATPITISGSKFGNVQSDVEVRINGIAAIVTAISDNQIQCIVPDRCGSGPITVGVKGKWSGGTYFIYDWAARFTTVAGASGAKAFANGSGVVARFHSPSGMCRDQVGFMYIADQENNCIRKMNNFGEVSTIAGGTQGYADGQGTNAKFYFPGGVACDNSGNVYVADSYNNRIRKITPGGMVTTFAGSGQPGNADGRGMAASFSRPGAMAFDGTYLYVASGGLRKIDMTGNVTTVPGVSGITGMVVSPTRELFLNCGTVIKSINGSAVRIIAGNPTASGMVDGFGQDALFSSMGGEYGVGGIAMDGAGNLYVADLSTLGPNGNMTLIRRVSKDGMVTTASDQMNGYNSIIWSPGGLVTDNSGALYLADRSQSIILKIIFQ